MWEAKARMIVRESQSKGALESFLDPLAAWLLQLAAWVQRRPVLALLVLLALVLVVFRLAYRAK